MTDTTKMFSLGGDWFLTYDEWQWIVLKRSIGQSGASKGQPLYARKGYFTDERPLARFLPRKLSREPDLHSWLEMMESLTAQWQMVADTLKRARALERELERKVRGRAA